MGASGTKMAQINDASSSERYMRTASALDAMHCICTRFVSPSSPASKILSRLVSSGWGEYRGRSISIGSFQGQEQSGTFLFFFLVSDKEKTLAAINETRQSMKPRITHLVCDLRQTAESPVSAPPQWAPREEWQRRRRRRWRLPSARISRP